MNYIQSDDDDNNDNNNLDLYAIAHKKGSHHHRCH